MNYVKIVELPIPKQHIAMLLANWIDVFLGSKEGVNYILQKNFQDEKEKIEYFHFYTHKKQSKTKSSCH